jgi:hypothetical protein
MRLLPTFMALLLPGMAWSQTSCTSLVHSTTIRLRAPAALYEHLAESSAARSALHLRPDEYVVLVGVASPNWFVVSRSYRDTPNTSISYFMRKKEATILEIIH